MIIYAVQFPFNVNEDEELDTFYYPSMSAVKKGIAAETEVTGEKSSPVCAGEIIVFKITTNKLTKDVLCRALNYQGGFVGAKEEVARYRFIPGKRLKKLDVEVNEDGDTDDTDTKEDIDLGDDPVP